MGILDFRKKDGFSSRIGIVSVNKEIQTNGIFGTLSQTFKFTNSFSYD